MARRTKFFTALFLVKWLAVGLFFACRNQSTIAPIHPSDRSKVETDNPPEADTDQDRDELEALLLLAQKDLERQSYMEASAHLSDGILVFRNRTGHFHGPKAATVNQTIGQLAAMRSRLRRSQPIDRDALVEVSHTAVILVKSQ